MLLRVWWFGHEVLTIQLVRQDPVELLAEAMSDQFEVKDEGESSASLVWTSSEPDDGPHVVWSSVESDME